MEWRGEPAWVSTDRLALAVVTETRSRLIYLGSLDGTHNLLNAPYPHVLPTAEERWPNQGGHRFWLGPQKNWIWPPPTEWEFSAAVAARSADGVLTLIQPQFDSAYPALVREYAWDRSRLRCTAWWRPGDRHFFGMHIVPVDLPFTAEAGLHPCADLPLGLVEITLDGASLSGFLPHPALHVKECRATLQGGLRTFKAGFPVQPLTVQRSAGWRLSVAPGPHEGVAVALPDSNCLSQIWVGGPEYDLAELEQLTPYLAASRDGRCASTIFLAALPPHPA